MKTVEMEIEGMTQYSQAKVIDKEMVPFLNKETHEEYEKRTRDYKMHITKEGYVEIPPTSFAIAIKSSAQRLAIKIPGKGNMLYTKAFDSGILCVDSLVLTTLASQVRWDRLHVPADGKRGGTTRVWKYFPIVEKWGGNIKVFIVDDQIPKSIFEQVAIHAGQLVGVGRYRPERGGMNGRFRINKFTWS